MDYLKVSSKSSPASVAGAIAGLIKDGLPVEIQSVGAGAVNQAVKAIAIARGFLIPTGIDVYCTPTFQDIEIDGENRTAIRLSVFARKVTVSDCGDLLTQQISGNMVATMPLPAECTYTEPVNSMR